MVINRSEKIKGLKEKAKNDGELSKEDKKTLSDEEKEQKSLRKQIQDKLIKLPHAFRFLCIYQIIGNIV